MVTLADPGPRRSPSPDHSRKTTTRTDSSFNGLSGRSMAIPAGSEWTAGPSGGYPAAISLCTPGVMSAGIWIWNRYGAALEIWLKPSGSVPMTPTARKARRGVASTVISTVSPGAKTVPLDGDVPQGGLGHQRSRPDERCTEDPGDETEPESRKKANASHESLLSILFGSGEQWKRAAGETPWGGIRPTRPSPVASPPTVFLQTSQTLRPTLPLRGLASGAMLPSEALVQNKCAKNPVLFSDACREGPTATRLRPSPLRPFT